MFCWSVLFLLCLDSNHSFYSTLLEKEGVSMVMPAEVENTFFIWALMQCVCVGWADGLPCVFFCAWQQCFFPGVLWQRKLSTLFFVSAGFLLPSVNCLRLKSNQADCSETPLTSDPCWSPHLIHIRSWPWSPFWNLVNVFRLLANLTAVKTLKNFWQRKQIFEKNKVFVLLKENSVLSILIRLNTGDNAYHWTKSQIL